MSTLSAGISFDAITFELTILNETRSREIITFEVYNDLNATLAIFNYTVTGLIEIDEILVDDRKPSYEVRPLNEARTRVQLRIPLHEPLPHGGRSTIRLTIVTTGHVEKDGERFMFSRNFGFPTWASLFRCAVYLPEGAMLLRPGREGAPALFFPPGDISHDGRQLKISWMEVNLEQDDTFVSFILYEFPPQVTTIIKEVPVEDNYTIQALRDARDLIETLELTVEGERSDKLALSAFLLIETVALVVISYLMFFPREEGASDVNPIILDSLDEDEASVLAKIVAQEGPITQREVQDLLGFSKAKLSRTLDRLENKGLVQKARCGRTNKLHITEKALK